MNKKFIIAACVLCVFSLAPSFSSTNAETNAQGIPPAAEQQRKERMQAGMRKNMALITQENAAFAEQGREEMIQAGMRKMILEKRREAGIAAWKPTAWQKALPPVKVKEGDTVREYSFIDLIRADGFLCPGSARPYKALQVALPLLYEDAVPVKGDFKITHGSSLCTSLVLKHFMQGFTGKKFLKADNSIRKKLITVRRLSTGKEVTVVFDPTGVQGHDAAAARAGDVILHAEDGRGMSIRIKG